METIYEIKPADPRLISGSTSLAEAKKLGSINTSEDILMWKEVSLTSGDYPPTNKRCGCTVSNWGWR